MKFYSYSLVLFLQLNLATAQIVVDTMKLVETVDNTYVSHIPRVRDVSNANNQAVARINAFLLDRFMIPGFRQEEIAEFRWYDLDFRHEIGKDILFIGFAGEYYGAYPNYIEEELYFDLHTGEQLFNRDIPFQAFFSLHGYLDFMNRFWIKGAIESFTEATDCADSEPYCSYYDIYDYSVDDNQLSISLADDCFPRVLRACSPSVSLTISVDSLKEYLSTQGRKILLEDKYASKTGVEKFLFNSKIPGTIPNHMFIFGKIDGKYAFSMALNFDNTNKVSGYYFYDRKKEKLQLTGIKKDEATVELTESFNGKQTGFFVLTFMKKHSKDAYSIYNPNDESTYLQGTWSNPGKNKSLKIEFTEVKMNDRK